MASAANLGRSGASYDVVLNDKMTKGLDRVIAKLDQLDKKTRGIQMPQLGRIGKQLRTGNIFAGFTAVSTTISAVIQKFMYLEQVVYRVFRTISTVVQALMSLGRMFITTASDMTEAMNAFNAVFGRTAKSVSRFFDDFADQVGRSRLELKRSATAFQSLYVGLGAGRRTATELSTAMQQVAVDFGSFRNITDREANQRFISALAGSTEVLDRFGINIRENQTELRAQALGFGDNIRKMTEYQKALVRSIIIVETLGRQGAIGDALKTSEEWANQIKALAGAWENFLVQVGGLLKDSFLPVLQAIVDKMQDINKSIEPFTEKLSKALATDVLATWEIVAEAMGLLLYMKLTEAFSEAFKFMHKFRWERLMGEFWGRSFASLFGDQQGAFGGPELNKWLDPRIFYNALLDKLDAQAAAPAKNKKSWNDAINDWIANAFGFARTEEDLARRSSAQELLNRFLNAARMESFRKAAAGAADALKDLTKQAREGAAKTFQETRTPLEQFKMRIDELNKQFQLGGLSRNAYDRAALMAAEQYQKSLPGSRRQAASVGFMTSGAAREASRFAPAFDPLIDETKKQTGLLQTLVNNTNVLPNLNPLAFQ